MMKQDNEGQSKGTVGLGERGAGFFIRAFNRYRGTMETPFRWFHTAVNFDSDKDVNPNDRPTLLELCDRNNTTLDAASRNLSNIRYRSYLYLALSVIFASIIIMREYTALDSHLILMFFELCIPLMFFSWGFRLSFWSFQLRYGLQHQDRPLPSISSFIKNPEYWF